MIILLHGDDIPKISTKRKEVTDKDGITNSLDLKKATHAEVLDALSSTGLFTEKKTVILNNLKSLHHTKRKKLTKDLSKYKKDPYTKIIIVYEDTLEKKIVAQLDVDQELKFELPKYFFTYLDSLVPGKADKLHGLMQKLGKNIEGEQLFYATINRLRLLMMLNSKNSEKFDEARRINPWLQQRLRTQASKWSENNMIEFYKGLMDIEFGMKTSNLPLTPIKHLDLLILKHLK